MGAFPPNTLLQVHSSTLRVMAPWDNLKPRGLATTLSSTSSKPPPKSNTLPRPARRWDSDNSLSRVVIIPLAPDRRSSNSRDRAAVSSTCKNVRGVRKHANQDCVVGKGKIAEQE